MSAQWHPQWAILANLHRPTDPASLAASIREMADRGLKALDIAESMRLDIAVVLQALRAPS